MAADMDTIIGDDIVFKGSLKFNGKLSLKGQFKGTIDSGGELVIEETANVDADIVAGIVLINGKLRGNLEAKERIEIQSSGVVNADIKTPILVVESGAKFIGNSVM